VTIRHAGTPSHPAQGSGVRGLWTVISRHLHVLCLLLDEEECMAKELSYLENINEIQAE